jgi:sec1 family domain-containing protein 1
VVSTVAQLMDCEQQGRSQSGSSVDAFLVIDPLVEAGRPASEIPQSSAHEAIVFIVGGGNYLERERLVQWGKACTPKRQVIYGATELLTGAQFCEQLATLGKSSNS